MPDDLTLTAALAIAVSALAAAVGVLWRDGQRRHETLEKRTESHLAVATEQMRVLALMGTDLRNVDMKLDRIGNERTAQIAEMERKLDTYHETDIVQHAGQMRVLAAIEATILQRRVEPIVKRSADSEESR